MAIRKKQERNEIDPSKSVLCISIQHVNLESIRYPFVECSYSPFLVHLLGCVGNNEDVLEESTPAS
jgi:hypothetical protein